MKEDPKILSILVEHSKGINNKGFLVIEIPADKIEHEEINFFESRNESAASWKESHIDWKEARIKYKKAKLNCNKISGDRFLSDEGLVDEPILNPSSRCLKKIIRLKYKQFDQV